MKYYKDLTPTDIAKYREIFDIFDSDRGGYIEEEEIRDVMRTMGQNPTEEEIKNILFEVDEDNDG